MKKHIPLFLFLPFILIFAPACLGKLENLQGPDGESDPPAIAVGERLFLETRFAQFFQASTNGNVNAILAEGDPSLGNTQTLIGTLPGPFRGKSMNCRACHLVDEQVGVFGGGIRTYTDFARRSPIPIREDGKTVTPRNSPSLVNSTFPRDQDLFLHFDGEFFSIEDLAKGTLTGRNFGWLSTEKGQAAAHIAQVIRGDDGSGELAQAFGGLAYKTILTGEDPTIPNAFRLPKAFRIDVATATDGEILKAVARLIGAYVNDLQFSQDNRKEFNASPYDLFLEKNRLPRKEEEGESHREYSRRLLSQINGLTDPQFVTPMDGSFQFHSQDFTFGPKELQGLKIFFAVPKQIPISAPDLAQGKIGNCVACHSAPTFTDFRFHNVGIAQEEYDAIFGAGTFGSIAIPSLSERNASPESFLPPTPNHPAGSGPFLDVPASDRSGHTDLGLWNVFANAEIPEPQTALLNLLCEEFSEQISSCDPAQILPLVIAYFKTPGLRDLGHSAPYFHNGQTDTLEDVIHHYLHFSNFARADQMRNPSSEISGIALLEEDVDPLAAFLRALNEDYN